MLLRGARLLCVLPFAPSLSAAAESSAWKCSDAAGGELKAAVELVSEANRIHRSLSTNAAGRYDAQDLPFGLTT